MMQCDVLTSCGQRSCPSLTSTSNCYLRDQKQAKARGEGGSEENREEHRSMGGVSLGGEESAWEQEAQMPIIQGMGTKGMGGGKWGKTQMYLLSHCLHCLFEFGSWCPCAEGLFTTSLRHY